MGMEIAKGIQQVLDQPDNWGPCVSGKCVQTVVDRG